MEDDPLSHVIRTTLGYNYHTSRYLQDLLNNNVNDVQIALDDLKRKLSISDSSRVQLYRSINREFTVHDIYSSKTGVSELDRVSWTRLRLSAHSLAVEEGRWNRRGRGRLPMEERLCTCGQVQTERHIIEQCHRSALLRQQYGISTMENLLIERNDHGAVCNIVHKFLALYE